MNIRTKAISAVCAACVVVSGFFYSERSMLNLREVDPPLQAVAECAIRHTPVDFVVIDGGRTAEEHQINVANGKSWTTRSRHQDGKAIDIAAWVNGRITYDSAPYYQIAEAFYACSKELNVPIVWGGEWKAKDLMHFELDRRYYP